jgi:hypothetical protein
MARTKKKRAPQVHPLNAFCMAFNKHACFSLEEYVNALTAAANEKKKPIFICVTCGKVFRSNPRLKQHEPVKCSMLHSVQSIALRKLVDTNPNAWLSICARFRRGVPANSSNSGSSTHHAAGVMMDVAMSYGNADISSGSGSSAVVTFNADGSCRIQRRWSAARREHLRGGADAILNSSVEDNTPDFPGNADEEASKQQAGCE